MAKRGGRPKAKQDRPEVWVNFALTWDGRISTRNRTPADFSSKADKRRLVEIRSRADAVLVGAATLSADRMTMGLPDDLQQARLGRGEAACPIRVILSQSGRIDPMLPVFEKRVSPILIFSTRRMTRAARIALETKATLHLADGPKLDFREMLRVLHREYGVRKVDCEGGARVFRTLLEQDLVDAIHVTFVPRVFGGGGAPTLTGVAGAFLPRATACAMETMECSGDECFVRYRVLR